MIKFDCLNLDTYNDLEKEFVGLCMLAGADIHLETARSNGRTLYWYSDQDNGNYNGSSSAVSAAVYWCTHHKHQELIQPYKFSHDMSNITERIPSWEN